MEIPFKRVTWNEHEATLLIKTYEEVQNGIVPRNVAISQLSKRLRNRMIIDGIAINDKYRNVSGIELQLNSIERYVGNGEKGFGPITISKIFEEMLNLKEEDGSSFNVILNEARLLYPEVNESAKPDNSDATNSSETITEYRSYVENQERGVHILSEPIVEVYAMRPTSFDWNKYEAALLMNLYSNIVNGILDKKESCQLVEKRINNCSSELRRTTVVSSSDISDALNNIDLYKKDKSISINKELKYAFDLFTNDNLQFRELLISSMKLYLIKLNAIYTQPTEVKKETIEKLDVASKIEIVVESEDGLSDDPQRAEDNNRIKSILIKKFQNGFRLNSNMDRKRFLAFYKSEYNEDLDIDGEILDNEITKCGIEYKNKVYVPDIMLTQEAQSKLFDYVEKQFSNNIPCIYYNVLFDTFSDKFNGENKILDESMLKIYLEYLDHNGDYCFDDKYFSKEYVTDYDVNAMVISYVKDQGGNVCEEEVISAFPYLPKDEVLEAFTSNKYVLLWSGRKTRFHIDNFQLEAEDKQKVIDYLILEIDEMKFVSFWELIDKIRALTPRVVDNNIQFSKTGIRSALSVLLGNLFYFRGGIISDIKHPISVQDTFTNFARGRDSFSIEEVQMMADDFNTPINFEALTVHNIRVSNELYVDKQRIFFDVEKTDYAITMFCKGDFISISDISTYVAFPSCGYNWNEYLLESYLWDFSKKFRLFHNRFNKTSVSGAIVRRSSNYNEYTEILAKVLAVSNVALDKNSVVLDFLAENGFIGRRQLDGIEQISNRAKSLKTN